MNRLRYRLNDLWYEVKCAFQRFFRKYDDRSAFGLNTELTEHMLFGLRAMRKNSSGVPAELLDDGSGREYYKIDDSIYESGIKKWRALLDEMIDGLERGVLVEQFTFFDDSFFEDLDNVDWDVVQKKRDELLEKRDKALQLIVKHYDSLWD